MSIPIGSRGLVHLPSDSIRITDADEEVFLLYTQLASFALSRNDGSGLGSVNSKSDLLTIHFEIQPPTLRRVKDKKTEAKGKDFFLEVILAQDVTALRSRKGDTGSVLWRASVHLANYLLSQYHFPPEKPLLSSDILSTAHVYELGSGTGLMGIILSPYVSHYTATDMMTLLPLIRKNLDLNPSPRKNVIIDDLEWVKLNDTPIESRKIYFPPPIHPVDLILCIDCIYNPSLIPPLLSTLNHLVIPDRTAVLVVVELRDEDVLREFLEKWIAIEGWQVWRIGDGEVPREQKNEATRGEWNDARFAAWVGWKPASDSPS